MNNIMVAIQIFIFQIQLYRRLLHLSKGRLIVLQKIPTMLCCTASKITLQCQCSMFCSNCVYQESITRSAFTLTLSFCLNINSNCVGAWGLLGKDVGEETVACELLPATWLSLMGESLPSESPHGQVKKPAYYAWIMLDAFSYLYAHFCRAP